MKKSRRSRTKHPALKKEMNLRHRQEYIDCEYLNGVKNNDGKTVIRPLTDSEKDWLNRFYEETISCSSIDENDFYEDKKIFYKEDYRRRNDVFNIARILGTLEEIEFIDFDKMATENLSFEDALIRVLDIKLDLEKWFDDSPEYLGIDKVEYQKWINFVNNRKK